MGISQPLPVQAAAPIRAAHATDAAATPATTPAAGDAWSQTGGNVHGVDLKIFELFRTIFILAIRRDKLNIFSESRRHLHMKYL
jgi:hypothetical protein